MNSDIVDLRSFYASLLGRLAERAIAMALSAVWAKLPDERLVGMGYALPWLDRFGTDAERVFAFMPGTQGAVNWPVGGPSSTALVFDEELPLPDSTIDRFLLVHLLEHSENPRETLKEIWRVLAPGGRLVIVVPNRRGDLGAVRAHAVRHRPAVFTRPTDRTAARNQFHAERLERSAVLPAIETPLDDALPPVA